MMKRRKFLIDALTSSTGWLLLPSFPGGGISLDDRGLPGGGLPRGSLGEWLSDGWPADGGLARPHTYWMWMNGNITKEGITLDLEAMQRGGIGGAYMYNNAVGIPRGPVDYGSEEWTELVVHAVKEADRLGLVWTNGKEVDVGVITGVDLDKRIRIEPIGEGQPASLLLEFAESYEARAITLYRHPETPKDLFDGPRDYPPAFYLDSSEDGILFHAVCVLRCPALRAMDAPAAQSFPAVRAWYFRLLTTDPTYISRVELHAGPRLPDWPAKTNAAAGNTEPVVKEGVGELAMKERFGYDPTLAIDPARVIDLTDKMDAEGRLHWEAPAGSWTVLRIGHQANNMNLILREIVCLPSFIGKH